MSLIEGNKIEKNTRDRQRGTEALQLPTVEVRRTASEESLSFSQAIGKVDQPQQVVTFEEGQARVSQRAREERNQSLVDIGTILSTFGGALFGTLIGIALATFIGISGASIAMPLFALMGTVLGAIGTFVVFRTLVSKIFNRKK